MLNVKEISGEVGVAICIARGIGVPFDSNPRIQSKILTRVPLVFNIPPELVH